MSKFWGKLVCASSRKHPRAKRRITVKEGNMVWQGVPVSAGEALFQCPRCDATWIKKVKV